MLLVSCSTPVNTNEENTNTDTSEVKDLPELQSSEQ